MRMRIGIRKPVHKDAKRIYSLFANDSVLKSLGIDALAKDIKLSHERDWVKSVVKENAKSFPSSLHFSITNNGRIIGSIGAKVIDFKKQSAEIGYWLGENYWGRGFATVAVKRFCRQLFQRFPIEKIYSETFLFNPASSRVLEKAGFVFVRIKKAAALKQGKRLDVAVFVLNRSK